MDLAHDWQVDSLVKIFIRWFHFSVLPSTIMSDLPDNSRTNLIINYLPQTLSDAEFNQLFAALGPVQSARILRDKRTGYSFGYGFVNYQKEDDATRGKFGLGKIHDNSLSRVLGNFLQLTRNNSFSFQPSRL